jgi:hypothetical protein
MEFLLNSDMEQRCLDLDEGTTSFLTTTLDSTNGAGLNFDNFIMEDWTTTTTTVASESSAMYSPTSSNTGHVTTAADSIFTDTGHHQFDFTTTATYQSDTDSGCFGAAVSSVGSANSPHSSISMNGEDEEPGSNKLSSPHSSSASSMVDPGEMVNSNHNQHLAFQTIGCGAESVISADYMLDASAYEYMTSVGGTSPASSESIDTTLVNACHVVYGTEESNGGVKAAMNSNLMMLDGSCFDESELSKLIKH